MKVWFLRSRFIQIASPPPPPLVWFQSFCPFCGVFLSSKKVMIEKAETIRRITFVLSGALLTPPYVSEWKDKGVLLWGSQCCLTDWLDCLKYIRAYMNI